MNEYPSDEERYPYRDLGPEGYYTTGQAAEFLTMRGFPISKRYFSKIATPAERTGPKPDRRFGGRNLYLGSTLLAWAQGRAVKEDGQ